MTKLILSLTVYNPAADESLYLAKEDGRNQVTACPEVMMGVSKYQQ